MSVHRCFNPAKRKRLPRFGPGSWVKPPGDPRLKREKQIAEWQKARKALADAGVIDASIGGASRPRNDDQAIDNLEQ